MYGANSGEVPGVEGKATTNSGEAVTTGADFTVTDGTWYHIYGGYGTAEEIHNNRVILGGTITINPGIANAVYGGYGSGDVENNTVIVENGATVDGKIYGGYSSSGTVSGNNVYIYGNVTGDVYAGRSQYGTSTGNTVTLGDKNDPTNKVSIKNLVLNAIGSWQTPGSGTLNVYNSGHDVGGYLLSHDKDWLATGATINFYINSQDMNQDGSNIILSVRNNSRLDGVTINAGVRNAGSVKKGDKIILIAVVGPSMSLYVDGDTKFNTIAASDGIMKAKLDIQLYGSSGDGDPIDTSDPVAVTNGKIVATALHDAEADLGSDSAAKSPVETMAASVSLINAGADMMAGEAMTGAAQSTAISAAEGSASTLAPFAAVGGSKTRVESGSHVDLKSWNIAAGFAKEVENKQGKLMFAPVVEYGRGSYDSYLDNGTHGDGTSSFLGIGVMAKQTNKDGLYYEGSLRGGRVKSDYDSNFVGAPVSYDTSAAYYAMHLGVGKVVKLDEKDSLDCYGKLFYSHQAGDRAHLSNGYDYDFKAVDSIRTRLGVRYTHKINDNSNIYTGLAWQHEFDSEARATIINGGTSFDAPSPSIKGDTGIFELGWKIKPGKGNFETGLGLTGSVGKQRGIGLNAQFQWKFYALVKIF